MFTRSSALISSTSSRLALYPTIASSLANPRIAFGINTSSVRFAATKAENQAMDIKFFGIPADLYIPPSPKNVPPIYKNPKLFFRSYTRRLVNFVKNTAFVAQFRLKSKIKPRFVEWKNLALETYVDTNHAFAERRLDLVRDRLSLWVYESLKGRLKSVPDNVKLNWKLVKFNSTPKVVLVQPLVLPDKPMRDIQIVYKIETRQRLAKTVPGSSEPQVVEHDVVDYAAFTFDASKIPARVYFAGTVFESSLEAPMPTPLDDPQKMMNSMRTKGDIFRSPPAAIDSK